ncbi:Gfo/Idh/MocA family oxidoreductase [Anaerococcus sp. NML200537]|uniref:Gfo/Idh/MocA family oxidoreductase n=1 Tax=Anaerococcus sp. NML200537 TaxID=2954485 RepID=UPI00223772BE|nr:Gfo/Idh/MocA family oxidoreductase [Anaerococcus sp. NML200537]MCW6702340.1 Gfo/Idh/MocA family oxidoreductase [Anaerococcus sp. NML200537]
MKMKKINTIVCGTTFGEFYIKALKELKDDFELCGILCNGSERSKRISEKYNIPYYLNIKDIPINIDLACVILRTEGVGGNGTDVCMSLLSHGINVIQEQPVFKEHLEKCYKQAIKNDSVYMTANLYSNFENIRKFIKYARKLNIMSELEYINVTFSTQLAYIAFDLISMSGLTGSLKIDNDIKSKFAGPFKIVSGLWGNIPIVIEFNDVINPTHPDYNMQLMYSLNYYYKAGLLSLDDAFGNVFWRPRSYVSNDKENESLNNELIYKSLFKQEEITYKDFYNNSWVKAIEDELVKIKNEVDGGILNRERANREFNTAHRWKIFQDFNGFARFTNDKINNVITIKDIEESL